MPKIVISDSSILIIFHKIKEFSILQKVYGELITTPEIIDEFGEDIPDWIKILSVKDRKYQEFL
jgi:predicted nucleic acid-binding protein